MELAALLDRVPATRQLIVNMTSASGGSRAALEKPKPRRHHRNQERHRKERHRVRPLLGRSAARSGRRHRQERNRDGARSVQLRQQKTAQFYDTQKRLATEHPTLEDTGQGDGARKPSPENGQGLLASHFTLLRFGSTQSAATTPEKKALLDKREDLEQQIDKLKYEKAALPPDEYKKQIADLFLELAKTQAELDK